MFGGALAAYAANSNGTGEGAYTFVRDALGICSPANMSNPAIRAVVGQYLAAHPEDLFLELTRPLGDEGSFPLPLSGWGPAGRTIAPPFLKAGNDRSMQ